MSRTSSPAPLAQSTESTRPFGRDDTEADRLAADVLAEIARTLWATKTAENIAAIVGCKVRSAERYLSGEREWSAAALAAIVAEICRRHGVRNIRIKPR